MTKAIRPVFVFGTARSGTTWLANLLASHPRIAAVTAAVHQGIHESHLLSHTQYCFPPKLSFPEFIDRYEQEDYFKLTGLDKRQLLAGHSGTGDVCDFFALIMDEYARSQGADFWLEKTPKHVIYHRELEARFPGATFVIIERHFRDTLLSQLNKYARPGAPRWLQILEKILRYESDRRAIARVKKTSAATVVSLRYEDLVEDTQGTINRVLDTLGVERRPLQSRFPPASSYAPGKEVEFRFSTAGWTVIEVVRGICALVPYRLLAWLRRRRDRKEARSFPKYSLIEARARIRS